MTSTRTRLIRLLDRGFYPAELPPTFRTRRFSSVKDSLNPAAGYSGSTTFFDGATFRGTLRTFGVINPVSYSMLSRFIASNWGEISKVIGLSGCSGARPKFPSLAAQGRAIEPSSIATKRRSQRHLASVYPVILGLDINRFYGSIYTHSIPWAALGKQEAKRRYRARSLAGHWSDQLDILARNGNQRQTVGIPIGPDTSRIISEIILARIDSDLTSSESGLSSSQIFHNIDDYQIGVFSHSGAENAQSKFVRAISRYELRLNDFKTSVDHGMEFSPSNFQRAFDVLSGQTGSNFVEHFFDILYSSARRYPDMNVLGYGLKRFARSLATSTEGDLVREYLQRLLFAAPYQARWIMPLLLGFYRQKGADLEIKGIISWGIETCVRRNDVGSLLWFLYSAIFLQVKIGRALCRQCIGMSNELVDLVLFHGRSEGSFSFSVADLRGRYQSSDFSSPAWLPLYEVGRRGWDTSASFTKIGRQDDVHGLYAHLHANNVEFYDTAAECFDVASFEGWNLTQDNFNPAQRDWRLPEFEFGAFDEWENYE